MGTTTKTTPGSGRPTKGTTTASPGAKLNGNGKPRFNGKPRSNGAVSPAERRRLATTMGRSMLVATSIETARHSDDVVVIVRALCRHLGVEGGEREDVLAAARLHDVGKASVPEAVLHKAGALTAAEWKLMRNHTVVGEEIVASVGELDTIAQLIRSSHERWDGTGYPDGLKGEEIPFGSRIIFCADAFHAIRSDRPYRSGRPAPEVLAEVKRCSGTQFDPKVVEALEGVAAELSQTSRARGRRSGRLASLLLVLALGAGGSAIAKTGVLDQSESTAQAAAAPFNPCGPSGCPPMLRYSLGDLVVGGQATAAGHRDQGGRDDPVKRGNEANGPQISNSVGSGVTGGAPQGTDNGGTSPGRSPNGAGESPDPRDGSSPPPAPGPGASEFAPGHGTTPPGQGGTPPGEAMKAASTPGGPAPAHP